MVLKYSGIGSRQTPDVMLGAMRSIGEQLAERWLLRSGHAVSADQAFETGCAIGNGEAEIFLPWDGYNGKSQALGGRMQYGVLPVSDEQYAIAEKYHPAWHRCTPIARLLHARNVPIILGDTLDDPVDMVVCWTLWGKGGGGTGQGIRIAKGYGIPVYDIALAEDQERLIEFTEAMERRTKEVTLCKECGQPQFETPSGITCANGHGGADSVTESKSD